jgi:hypothetical protein
VSGDDRDKPRGFDRLMHKGACKNTLDLRRCAAVANLQRLARAA